MAFRRADRGTRMTRTRSQYEWQVEPTRFSVRRASPVPKAKRQPPLPRGSAGFSDGAAATAVPSYALGSSATMSPARTSVQRHHAVPLRHHDNRRVLHEHNAPLSATAAQSIASPRQKQRKAFFSTDDTFSLAAASSSSSSSSSASSSSSSSSSALGRGGSAAAATAAAASAAAGVSSRSAKDLASSRRQAHHVTRQQKLDRIAQFERNLKRRVTRRVRTQRAMAQCQRNNWAALEQSAQKSAAEWVRGESEATAVAASRGGSPPRRPRKTGLQQHVLNVTAATQKARSALVARSRRGQDASAVSGWSGAELQEEDSHQQQRQPDGKAKAAPAPPAPAAPAAAPLVPPATTQPGELRPDDNFESPCILHNGLMDAIEIEHKSAAHLVAAARAAESKAQRLHARRYREQKRRRAAARREEARAAKLQEEQDKLIEQSRLASSQARDEYTAFLKEVESGVVEMERSQQAQKERESHVASRYVVALRQRLLKKLNGQGLHVPTLCSCLPPEGRLNR